MLDHKLWAQRIQVTYSLSQQIRKRRRDLAMKLSLNKRRKSKKKINGDLLWLKPLSQ
ncbi:hypothetical protein B7P43_G11414 [Cryptotermes secundus]|uniref:Uncharacterized protein n=1 Tax=Cryptotermes secundus TaxID=105785 RepID=A0A2J7RSG2_9NEOP|nr:hypothetical protein B7P43_G11414 [Cryptotermes secundus]